VSVEALVWAKAEIWRRNQKDAAASDRLSASETVVLLMIADHFNNVAGRSWPSQARLAIECGVNVRTIGRAVNALRKHGVLVTEDWEMNGSDSRTNMRYLLPGHRPDIRRAPHGIVIVSSAGTVDLVPDDVLQVPGTALYGEPWMPD
jgi:hypothetical protein